ncbi:hypothetical protein BJ742DRAFT_772756 [Cladochytrium replicatum]|nr:hypothetical protein BJ742DRAFT_772756 [Cladochytrium replicatum]
MRYAGNYTDRELWRVSRSLSLPGKMLAGQMKMRPLARRAVMSWRYWTWRAPSPETGRLRDQADSEGEEDHAKDVYLSGYVISLPKKLFEAGGPDLTGAEQVGRAQALAAAARVSLSLPPRIIRRATYPVKVAVLTMEDARAISRLRSSPFVS